VTATNINITTASSSGTGTLKSTIRTSGGGYYRVFAWA
jgi:hypothetical protein